MFQPLVGSQAVPGFVQSTPRCRNTASNITAEPHRGTMFRLYMSLDVELIDGSPSADAAHPPLGGGSSCRVGINEGIQ